MVMNIRKLLFRHVSLMSQPRKDFQVKYCGMVVDKEHPWLNATPDFMSSCSCCGDGCGEVKYPYSVENGDFQSFISKKTSCLEMVNGILKLKKNYQYYMTRKFVKRSKFLS